MENNNSKSSTLNLTEPDVIHIYTDGACSGNPGPAGWGVVLVFNDHIKEMSDFIGEATNNIAELTAIKKALETVKKRDLKVNVYVDSDYAIGVLTKSWKIRANNSLVDETRQLIDSFDDISFHKVAGHAGIKLNERADKLACLAINQHKDAYLI